MPARAKTFLCALLIGLVACGATALLVAGVRRTTNKPSLIAQTTTSARTTRRRRNLSLQPEALRLARQVGARFLAEKNATSALVGTLTIGSERRTMQVTRKLLEDGGAFKVVDAKIPTLQADRFMRLENLDRLGPARYAELPELKNATIGKAP